MLSFAAALAIAAALPTSDAAADPELRHRRLRVAVISAGILLFIASETVAKDAISPDECRWCNPGNFDDGARELAKWANTDRAARLSNLIGYGLAPIAASGLLLVASAQARTDWWNTYANDMTAMFEIIWGVQLVTQAVKIAAARERPYVNYNTDVDARSQEKNLSFFSGHSSLTFSLAVGSGLIAQRRGYRLAPVIWASGLAIAATTGYLRMAADRHYATDVLVGAAAGALGAVLIPQLTGSLPPRATIVPQPGGLALVGRF
jgi:membrane-associated phospholipid phosphatase